MDKYIKSVFKNSKVGQMNGYKKSGFKNSEAGHSDLVLHYESDCLDKISVSGCVLQI